MTQRKKECDQEDTCKWWPVCKFAHDASKCRIATDHNDAAVDEID